MPTHKILVDLDVGGEVKGTSLDINGNADIAGDLAIDGTVTIDTDTGNQPFYITRSGATDQALSIKVMDDNVRFESIQDESIDNYGGFEFNMDGGTTEPDFTIRKSGGTNLFNVRGDGNTTFAGNIITSSNSAVIQTPRISMEADGTLDWGAARDYGTLTFDTGKIMIRALSGKAMELQTNGSTTALTLDTSQNATFAGTITIPSYIYHTSDPSTDTYFGFNGNDNFTVVTAGGNGLVIDSNRDVTFTGSLIIPAKIIHSGDTNTYFGFDLGADTFRVVAGGTEKLKTISAGVDITGVLQADSLDIDGAGDVSGDLNVGSLSVDGKAVMNLPSNNPERGPFQPLAAMIRGTGTAIYGDEDFNAGSNSVNVYNNAGGTGVVHTREEDGTTLGQVAPNSSGQVIKVVNNGNTTSPGRGGFYQTISAAANQTFVQVFQAKIPSGYTVELAENAQGTNNTSYWLTSQSGTGKFEWYVRVSHCGNTGSFSSGGHVYINGGSAGDVFTWYLASSEIYQVTDASTKRFRNLFLEGNLTIPGPITHDGDTNTYLEFHADDQWRVVTGGSERLEVSNSGLKLGNTGATVSSILDEDAMGSNSATALATQQSIKAYVDTSVANLVDSAPGTLNTLNELAAALGDDASFSTTVTNSIATKLPLAGGTMTGDISMGNGNITNVNVLTFNDPGPNEGLSWSGGNMKLYESPNDLTTNTAGNLQIVYGSTRRLTVDNSGIDVNGNIVVSGTVDGVDIAARDGVLTSTTTTAGAALPKAGGTMSGAIISSTSVSTPLNITSSNSTYTAIAVKNTSTGDAGIFFDAMNGDLAGSDYAFIGQKEEGELLYDIGVNSTNPVHKFTGGHVGIGITPVSTLHVYENSTETSHGAGITVENDGNGDATVQFLLTGIRRWATGIDHSDSDKFKIASSGDLGSDARFTLDTDGNAVFTGEVEAASLDINGNADISGNLTGLDNVTSTNFIIGGHTINDVDLNGEFVDSSEHLLTSAGAHDRFLRKTTHGQIGDTDVAFGTTTNWANNPEPGFYSTNYSGSSGLVFMTGDVGGSASSIGLEFNYQGSIKVHSNTDSNQWHTHSVWTENDFSKSSVLNSNVTSVSGSSGSCSGNAATATALTSGNKSITGTFTVSGNINANGNIVGDDGTSITNITDIECDTIASDADNTTVIQLGATSMNLLVADNDMMSLTETSSIFYGIVDITGTTDATNATGDTGILRCEGGASIAKKLYVGSTITGSADVIAFSDRKLKENIETLDGKKVLDMRGVSFTRKDTGAESSGVIAQEIQKVAPELVHDTEGTLGVAYGNLVGYLIEAVKDQQKQIDELKAIINGNS